MKNVVIPHLANEEIWKHAESIRGKFWNNTVPVNIDIIAEKGFNLDFVPIENLRKIVGAEAHISGDLTELQYEPNSPNVRLRFSIAHELGHAVLHVQQLKLLRAGSVAEWKEIIQDLPSGAWGRAEYQAREFAGRLLVPIKSLMKEIVELKPKIELAIEKMPDIEAESIYSFIAPHICKKFIVSDQVILARLHSE